jgi:hypothetical protein
MKFIATFTIFMTFCSFCFAGWFDNDTFYRLNVTVKEPGKVHNAELGEKIFPVSFDNGISVYSSTGKEMNHLFSKNRRMIFFNTDDNDPEYHIYFGFDKTKTNSKLDRNISKYADNYPLELTLVSFWYLKSYQYLEDEKGLLNLCNYTFEGDRNIRNIQNYYRQLYNLKRKIRKGERNIERTWDKKKKEEYIKQKDSYQKVYDSLEEKTSKIEEKLTKEQKSGYHYKRILPTPVGVRSADKILLDSTPLSGKSKRMILGARFKGRLFIEEEAEYEFALNSKDNSLLKIDGKVVMSWPGIHSPSEDWKHTAKVKLNRGLHELKFYYFRRGMEPMAELAWKNAEETEFRILDKDDFSPAYPTEYICENKQNNEIPIITFDKIGYFLLEDGVKANWIHCRVEGDNHESDLEWVVDKTVISNSRSGNFLQLSNSENKLTLTSKSGKFDDVIIDFPPIDENAKHTEPDLDVKIWTPSFIYDNEFLDMDIELVSGLERSTDILFKTTLSKPVSFIKEGIRNINLKGRGDLDTSRFSPASRKKEHIDIIGSELENGLDVSFYMMIPPLVFSKQSVKFAPVLDCEDAVETVDGLLDSKGRRIIPILHRPDLAEKRTWSLSKNIVNKLYLPRKLMVVADNFGTEKVSIKDSLGKKLKQQKVELEFESWQNPEFGSSIRGSIGKLIGKIKNSEADRILFVPSSRDVDSGIPVRIQTRALAALGSGCAIQ